MLHTKQIGMEHGYNFCKLQNTHTGMIVIETTCCRIKARIGCKRKFLFRTHSLEPDVGSSVLNRDKIRSYVTEYKFSVHRQGILQNIEQHEGHTTDHTDWDEL